jgi:hypothetical protein
MTQTGSKVPEEGSPIPGLTAPGLVMRTALRGAKLHINEQFQRFVAWIFLKE